MSEGRVRDAGDAALLLELSEVIDPRVNDAAIAAAAGVARDRLPGVRDVLATYRTVAVHFDPETAEPGAIGRALARAGATPVPTLPGPLIEVPVSYGGEHGPDLEEVAAWAGIPAARVAERHARREYRVFMLGFLPGFAYMGSVDPVIAAPRRSSPRMRVPAGSVGIAGGQTGVYPIDSPGGWQIVGRTPLHVFDASKAVPALFAPGCRVRFVPGDSRAQAFDESQSGIRAGTAPSEADAGATFVTVLSPGLHTTIQDEGRWGSQAMGVPVSGAMDLFSHRVANALAGNGRDAATLEMTLTGPELRMDAAATIAIAGADLSPTLDGTPLAMNTAVSCKAGSVIGFGERRTGGRAYVAFAGGIQVPPVLGSRSTHVRTRMGGLAGRALRAGDRLPLGAAAGAIAGLAVQDASGHIDSEGRTRPQATAVLRVLPGPQDDFFPASALDVLQGTRLTVTPQSDRMGYRLTGTRAIPRLPDHEMISDATCAGAIQVPPSGAPILLMADRQTTGGYPQLAVVISADQPRAGQLVPGDAIEFRICSRREAREALAAQRERLRAVE